MINLLMRLQISILFYHPQPLFHSTLLPNAVIFIALTKKKSSRDILEWVVWLLVFLGSSATHAFRHAPVNTKNVKISAFLPNYLIKDIWKK